MWDNIVEECKKQEVAMKKPLIGIVSKIRETDGKDLWHRQEVVDELRYLIVRHGGVAIMLMPSEETMDFNKSDLGDPKVLSESEIAEAVIIPVPTRWRLPGMPWKKISRSLASVPVSIIS